MPGVSPKAQAGSIGGLTKWFHTRDRTECATAPARKASPSDVEYHLARLDPEIFADANRRPAASRRRGRAPPAYFTRLA